MGEVDEKEALDFFKREWGLEGGKKPLEAMQIIQGEISGSPEWWLGQMQRGTKAGKEHLAILENYLLAKKAGKLPKKGEKK
jgi:hypothetical protein